MNLTPADYEALMLFLVHHAPLWAAHCRDMGVNPNEIAKALAAAHAEKVREL